MLVYLTNVIYIFYIGDPDVLHSSNASHIALENRKPRIIIITEIDIYPDMATTCMFSMGRWHHQQNKEKNPTDKISFYSLAKPGVGQHPTIAVATIVANIEKREAMI